MKDKKEEEILQEQCEGLLKIYKIQYLHLATAVTRGGKTSGIAGNKGWPDLTVYAPTGCFFVELKVKGRRLTKEQREKKPLLENAGYDYYVCRDFDNFREILEGRKKRKI